MTKVIQKSIQSDKGLAQPDRASGNTPAENDVTPKIIYKLLQIQDEGGEVLRVCVCVCVCVRVCSICTYYHQVLNVIIVL